jgi:hypothetical protein
MRWSRSFARAVARPHFPTGWRGLLETLAAAGEIIRAAEPKGNWTWRSRGLGLPAGTAQALLDELHEERA